MCKQMVVAVLVLVCVAAGPAVAQTPGTVWAWGKNVTGELGDNSTANRSTPVLVVNGGGVLSGVVAVAANGNSSLGHTLALRSDGTVWAWGYNGQGEIGDNTTTQRNAPVQVQYPGGAAYLTGMTAVAAGGVHSAALKCDGTVWTWGWNAEGELGDNTTATQRNAPVQVVGLGGSGYLTGVVAVAAGTHGTVALKTDGTVWTWGYNGEGELGDNTAATQRNTPVRVVGPGGSGYLTGVVAVAAGYYHTVALKSDGTVWTWGYNGQGALGDNTMTQRNSPVQVVGPGGLGYLTGVVAVSAGYYHTVALKSDGTVWTWGYDAWGELGDNGGAMQLTPVQVAGPGGAGHLGGVVAVAAGAMHTVALKSDGTVWAWGSDGDGELGDNASGNRSYPLQVLGLAGSGNLTGIAAVAATYEQTIAVVGPLPSYNLTAAVTGLGTVSCTPSLAGYPYGAVVTLTGSAAPRQGFDCWTCSGGSVFGVTVSLTTLFVTGDTSVVANFTPSVLAIAALTSTTWVYQNTPLTTLDRHVLGLTVSLTQETWGNTLYTTTVTQAGPGVVTPTGHWVSGTTVTPTLAASWTGLTGYLVGGRTSGAVGAAANMALTGSCTVMLSVVGDVSGPTHPATTSVVIKVRPLGDINGDGTTNTSDKTLLNGQLNMSTSPSVTGLDPAVWDLNGTGAIRSTSQKTLLNGILNAVAIP